MILAPIIGGLGTIFGPIVGAFILTPLGEGLIALTASVGTQYAGRQGGVLRPDADDHHTAAGRGVALAQRLLDLTEPNK